MGALANTHRWRAVIGLLRDAWLEYHRDRARYFAVAIIYYTSISVVPMLLLFVSTVGLLLRYSATAAAIERQILAGIEARFGSQLSGAITRLLTTLQRDSVITTIISVAGMVITASLLFRQLRLTFRAVWNYEPPLAAGTVRTRARRRS